MLETALALLESEQGKSNCEEADAGEPDHNRRV